MLDEDKTRPTEPDQDVNPDPTPDNPTETPDETASASETKPSDEPASAAETGSSDQPSTGRNIAAFKAMVEAAIAETDACASCRLTALTEVLAKECCDSTDTMVGAMQLGSSVNSGIRSSIASTIMSEAYKKPLGVETRVSRIDLGPLGPALASILMGRFGPGMRF